MAKLNYTPMAMGYVLGQSRPIDFKHDGYFYIRGGTGEDRTLGKAKTLKEAINLAHRLLEKYPIPDVVICLKRLDRKPRYYPGWEIPATNTYERIGLVYEDAFGDPVWESE